MDLFNTLLTVHIIGGGLSLMLGLLLLFLKKGDNRHQKIGIIYF